MNVSAQTTAADSTASTYRTVESTLVPLVVGIVGKRDIGNTAATVEQAIHDLLVELRHRHPSTPLLVLTALAEGSDWCAARATARFTATQRSEGAPSVGLVCPLPLSRALYEQDFSEPHRNAFARLLDAREIVTATGLIELAVIDLVVFELRPLDGADQAYMGRVDGRSQAHRTLHYEQAGLYLADACHLLVGVMPQSEVPSRIGGPARIIHYKCTGSLPADRPESAEPSFNDLAEALEKSAKLTALATRATHDLPTYRLRRLSKELPEPLPPSGWFSRNSGHAWHLIPGPEVTWRYLRGPKGRASPNCGEPTLAHRGEVFATTQPYEAFNLRAKNAYMEGRLRARHEGSVRFAETLRGEMGSRLNTAEYEALMRLSTIRGTIAELQGIAKTWADLSLWILAGLFLTSVGAFTYFKLWHDETWAAHTYLILLILAAGWYAFARNQQWSGVHDDYRAAAEALRVQIGWRLAGIRERVESHYRAGTTQQLERVRRGIETINTIVALKHREADIAAPFPLSNSALTVWVRGQIAYFSATHTNRHIQNERFLIATIGLFCVGLGLFLAIIQHAWHVSSAPIKPWLIFVAALGFVALILRFHWALPGLKNAKTAHAWINSTTSWLTAQARLRPWLRSFTKLYPILWCALLVILGLWVGDKFLQVAEDRKWPLDPGKWLGLLVALVNAGAAAAMYLREKLAIEPESRNYEEMTRVFLLADCLLEGTSDPAQQREVLIELGREALAENAYWLRAHRERPIEQIPG